MKVLVTGGAGFIGSHLVHALLNRGYSVRVLDDFSTGKRTNLPPSTRLEVVEGDVADRVIAERALDGCTAFVHLAAIASVERSVQDPVGTHRTNLEGSIVLFDAAAKAAVRRGLYASSAAVYGNADALPISENSPLSPLTPYAIDKLAGEQYLAFYHRSKKLDAAAFRFFNVYGPRQDPTSPYSGVISIFLDRAINGKQLHVYGDGLQSRDFVYVEDVVAALIAALESRSLPREMPIFNVARGESVSLLSLLSIIESLEGTKAPVAVVHEPPREGDIRHSFADIRRLTDGLGWAPVTDLASGLRATLKG